MMRRWASCSFIAAVGVAALAATAQSVRYEVRCAVGPAAPGGNPAITIAALGTPIINEHGRVVFLMRVQGPGIIRDVNDVWVVTDRNGPLEVLARAGDVLSDTGGLPLLWFYGGNINANGDVAIHGLTVSDAGGMNHSVIWRDRGAGLEKLASTLDAPPIPDAGASYSLLGDLVGPVLNDAGESAFYCRYAGGLITEENNAAMLVTTPGGLTSLLREGDPPPVADPAIQFIGVIDLAFPSLNNSGETVFRNVIGANPTLSALWRGGAQGLALAAKTGDPAPGAPDATLDFLFLFSGNLNDAGHFGFHATLQGPTVTSADNVALFAASDSGIRLVAREGGAIASAAGMTFRPSTVWTPALNSAGDVAVIGSMAPATGTPLSTVFREVGGELRPVASKGDAAVGAAPGYLLTSFRNFFFNDAGTIVFVGSADDDNFRTPAVDGVWSRTVGGELTPVFVPGRQIDVGAGVTPTVLAAVMQNFSAFSTRATGTGLPTPLNDADQFAALVQFSDAPHAIVVAAVGSACACEMDGATGIDVFDLLAYLDLWFVADAAAEVDGVAGVDVFDLLGFLDCWFGGCG